MLSILIPTYNYNVLPLCEILSKQAQQQNIDFEIICVDDASEQHFDNHKINSLENASYIKNAINIGRSSIRNLLASKAKFKYLLFLDADVIPVHNSFIKNYILQIQENNCVICGGLEYKNISEQRGLLRFKFGKKSEEVSEDIRNTKPYKYFFTSNFLIEAKLFQSIKFDESLKQYGREDLLFSLNLKSRKVNIFHINNPVYHLGLDENSVFVSKTEKAMKNLIYLESKKKVKTEEVSLLKAVDGIRKFGLLIFVASFHTYFRNKAINNASVLYFNFMKVAYLCKLKIAKHG